MLCRCAKTLVILHLSHNCRNINQNVYSAEKMYVLQRHSSMAMQSGLKIFVCTMSQASFVSDLTSWGCTLYVVVIATIWWLTVTPFMTGHCQLHRKTWLSTTAIRFSHCHLARGRRFFPMLGRAVSWNWTGQFSLSLPSSNIWRWQWATIADSLTVCNGWGEIDKSNFLLCSKIVPEWRIYTRAPISNILLWTIARIS